MAEDGCVDQWGDGEEGRRELAKICVVNDDVERQKSETVVHNQSARHLTSHDSSIMKRLPATSFVVDTGGVCCVLYPKGGVWSARGRKIEGSPRMANSAVLVQLCWRDATPRWSCA